MASRNSLRISSWLWLIRTQRNRSVCLLCRKVNVQRKGGVSPEALISVQNREDKFRSH